MEDLWGLGPIEEPKKKEKKVIEKIKTPKDPSAPKTKSSKGGAKKLALPLSMQIEEIRKEVFRILGKYAEDTICIRDVETFNKYIDSCIYNNIAAVDTETNNSIVPHTCKLMGLCLYTPGQKNAYVPINHVDINIYQQGVDQLSDEDRKKKLVDIDMSAWEVRLPNQLTEKDVYEGLTRLMLSTTFTELSNGKFDYEVLKCTCGVEIRMDWDTQYVAQLINENEEFKGLKPLYRKYIDSSDDKYDIEGLFEGLPYAIFDPELFALYAATDPYKTHMVSQYQIRELNKPDNAKILQLYNEIEKPLQKVVADMELRGVTLDTEITNALSIKYHKQLEEAKKVIDIELANLEPKIDAWRQTPEANYRYFKEDWLKKNPTINPSKYATNVLVGDKNKWRLNSIENMPFKIDEACAKSLNQQLSSPVCLTSPQQVAILLYDVLNVGVIDKKSPRSTGDDVMSKLEADIPLCRAIQDQKHMNKFLGTYIDKIPACVIPKTGAVHCSFKQDGAATGRFSSTDPNLQNIPSHAPEIRLMFKARPGYRFVGSDYSAQEPRLTSFISGDEQMLDAYRSGKDLYRVMAANVFHNSYDENGETWPDGSPNPEGKKRRATAKKLLLGITYGMQPPLLAQNIGCSIDEAKSLLEEFLNGFPGLKAWVEDVKRTAHQLGYAEGLMGRRRRLPDIQLPHYEVKYKDREKNKTTFFNPLLGSSGVNNSLKEDKLVQALTQRCENAKSKKDIDSARNDAHANGLEIYDNSGYIATAERQSVNSIIQGSAATMTKKAMVLCANDPWMVEHDCHLLIPIHDELLMECPEEFADKCAERLPQLMVQAAKELIGDGVPFKCDPVITKHWYSDQINEQYQEFYNDKLIAKGLTDGEAFAKMMEMHSEFTEEQMHQILEGNFI